MSQDEKIYCTVFYFEYNLYLFLHKTMSLKKTYTTEEARARIQSFIAAERITLEQDLYRMANAKNKREYETV